MKIRRIMMVVAIVAMLGYAWRHTTYSNQSGTKGVWVDIGFMQVAAYRQTWSNASSYVVHFALNFSW